MSDQDPSAQAEVPTDPSAEAMAPPEMPEFPMKGYQYMTFEWVMLIFTLALLINRLYVRVYLRGSVFSIKSWRWSEIFIVTSWLLYLNITISDSILLPMGFYNPVTFFPATPKEVIHTVRLVQWNNTVYYLIIYAAKAALVAFYLELTPEWHRKTLYTIYFTAFLIVVGTVQFIVHSTLACGPNYYTDIYNGKAASMEGIAMMDAECKDNYNKFLYTMHSLHIASDVLCFVIPFFLLQFLGKTRNSKIGVMLIFGTGLINLACACIHFPSMIVAFNGQEKTLKQLALQWMIGYVQSATAVMIPCLPQVRFTFRKFIQKKSSATPSPEDSADSSEGGARGSSDVEKGWFGKFKPWRGSSGSGTGSHEQPDVANVQISSSGEKRAFSEENRRSL